MENAYWKIQADVFQCARFVWQTDQKKTPKIFNIHEKEKSKAANSHILKTGAGECLAVFAQ